MVVEFSFENFLSIKERQTLSLLASKDSSNDDHLITFTPDESNIKQAPLLKTAAIYGANASGKSNILKAVTFFKQMILHSHKMQLGDPIDVVPFKLDDNTVNEPSRFEIIFIFNGVRYAYGFSVDREKVHEEYLYYFPRGRQSLIFERENTDEYTFTIDRKEQKELSARTPANMLYLSSATRWNYQKTALPFEWLKKHLRIVTGHQEMSSWELTTQLISGNPDLMKTVNRSLLEADLGIDAVKVSKVPVSEEIVLHTRHSGVDKDGQPKELYFKLEDESEGTQKFFALLGPFIDVLINGDVLFIDELEASLHPHLTKFLVNLFHDPSQNKKNSQLVFTTHDTRLLNLLRRDQVWFTEKNAEAGSTDLFSLVEFSPRKDQNIEKGYLAGRYGAVPFLGDGHIL